MYSTQIYNVLHSCKLKHRTENGWYELRQFVREGGEPRLEAVAALRVALSLRVARIGLHSPRHKRRSSRLLLRGQAPSGRRNSHVHVGVIGERAPLRRRRRLRLKRRLCGGRERKRSHPRLYSRGAAGARGIAAIAPKQRALCFHPLADHLLEERRRETLRLARADVLLGRRLLSTVHNNVM